jgi:uncharacterized protein (TIGR02466 family)
MSDYEMSVEPLFITPLAKVDLSSCITPSEVAFTDNLKMVPNQQNLISEDLYILRRPELAQFAAAISAALQDYAREVMGIDCHLEVTQSWAQQNQPGAGLHPHAHSNSIISGSFYYSELPDPPSRVFFDRSTAYQRLDLPPEQGRANLFNTKVNAVTPKRGELLLFPSELNHMVEANPAAQTRSVIAINSFIRGTIGNFRDVSELTV